MTMDVNQTIKKVNEMIHELEDSDWDNNPTEAILTSLYQIKDELESCGTRPTISLRKEMEHTTPIIKSRPLCGECSWKTECPFHCIYDCQLAKVKELVRTIPQGTEYHANRYNTDNEYVLCIWTNDKTYDIRFKKSKYPKEESQPPDTNEPCKECILKGAEKCDCPNDVNKDRTKKCPNCGISETPTLFFFGYCPQCGYSFKDHSIALEPASHTDTKPTKKDDK